MPNAHPSKPTHGRRARRSTQPACSSRRFTTTARHFCRGKRRSEEHTSELQSRRDLVCRLLLEKKNRWRFTISIMRLSEARPSGRAPLALCSPFFFNDTATTEIYTLSLHDALPI